MTVSTAKPPHREDRQKMNAFELQNDMRGRSDHQSGQSPEDACLPTYAVTEQL